jgi:hypothetical protein
MTTSNTAPLVGAFTLMFGSASRVFVVGQNVGQGSKLYEINMTQKTISSALCTYPSSILGCASVYKFSPSIQQPNTCNPLPIQMLNFNYRVLNNRVELIWETEIEVNNSFFLIEKSINGVDFEAIGQQKGAINSGTLTRYLFYDNNCNEINYYRLVQVDLDGKKTYSKVVTVVVPKSKPFKVIRNPVREFVEIQIGIEQHNIRCLALFDFSGRKLKSFAVHSGIQNLDVSSIKAGGYVLQLLTTNGQRFNEYFIRENY